MAPIRYLSSYWWREVCRGLAWPISALLDAPPIRANLSGMATSTRRAALYVRVSTSDRGQTVENQLQPLQEAAGRLGWTVVAISIGTRASVAPRGATGGLGWMPCSRGLPAASSTSWQRGRCVGWDDPCLTRSRCSVSRLLSARDH